ncbi:SPOR domain-containing protein [Sphingomonas mali]|uniref:SPOR domain-containing protein n=1 Tax=Sphingomonas mali TaxID=40682 RepID=UPI00083287DE|nr:SPOR domain-containing protein [Sphingomonas mali]
MSGGQAFAQTADENRDADALAADMRILAANPLDIEALVTAGELTLRMGDNTAAAGFFGRAEKLDPLNPRVKAGLGSLLVRAERPGEALRRFQEAEARGLDPSKYAGDRGLAYDLIGEQERAQRDYRLALRKGPDDEITRRYALSMGISGRKKEALDLLDPLLRKSDRAAWRDRAFILAMSGDRDGAQKIANSMMSPGLGAGLAPFFDRLPMLSAADRAFAINFGELRATPERLADARMVPALPRLGSDPTAPKVVVAVEQPRPRPIVQDDAGKRKKRKKYEYLAPAVPAATPAPPVEVAMNPPSYTPPRAAPTPAPPPPSPSPSPRVVYAAPLPTPKPTSTPTPTPLPPPVKVAEAPKSTSLPVPTAPTPASATVAAPPPAPLPAPVVVAAAPAPTPGFSATSADSGVADRPTAAEAGISPAPTATSRVSEDTVLARIIAGISVPGSELGVAPLPTRAAPPPPPAPKPVEPATEPKAKVEQPKPAARTPEPRSTVRKTANEDVADAGDSRSAKGRNGKPPADAKASKDDAAAVDQAACPPLTKGKTATRSRTTAKEKSTAKCEVADTKGGRDAKKDSATLDDNGCPPPAKGRAATRGKATLRGKSAAKCETADAKNARDAKDDAVALDKNGCPLPAKGKSGSRGRSEPPVTARGKTGAKGKASAKCEAADAKGAKADVATKGDPARVWVQVAGGANQAALEKAWNGLKAKSPDLFRNRQGWSTPLRATNRVLTGPFKSEDEAQTFVNQMAKAGLSGFVFTSTKGQKVDRLGGK